jgi:hypothetical protein
MNASNFRRRLAVMGLVALVIVSAALVSTEREVGACSCAGPDATLVAPERVDDAPLNARIRVEIPSPSSTSAALSPTSAAAAGGVVLRVHGRAATVAATTRAIATGGSTSFVELTPSAPLEPSTQYEVATVDTSQVPPSRVFGTFRTGRALDNAAPRIDAMGPAIAFKNANPMGSMCMVPGPWVTIEGVVADDPGRRDAQLVYAVWLGDASGAIDTKKPPTAVATAHAGRLDLGRTSLCDPHAFPFPASGAAWLGIAVMDEAGNTSAVRRMRVDLAGARQR